jgi:hypothetical protein
MTIGKQACARIYTVLLLRVQPSKGQASRRERADI